MSNTFLFSIDLEDIRDRVPNGVELYNGRVPEMTHAYMDFLKSNNWHCTFFVEGRTADRYPALIKEISSEGHEIACHSYLHNPITEQTLEIFSNDLDKNLQAIYKCGISEVIGYRAPVFSLTEKSPWVWKVLKEKGFQYSSSVLPAKNPLFGFPNFGKEMKRKDGIMEIPMNTSSFLGREIPFAGGVYFRVLPYNKIKKSFKENFNKDLPVLGYFHPYDIDIQQERLMHPGINESFIYNQLMYFNRKNVFKRLQKLQSQFEMKVITYKEWIQHAK